MDYNTLIAFAEKNGFYKEKEGYRYYFGESWYKEITIADYPTIKEMDEIMLDFDKELAAFMDENNHEYCWVSMTGFGTYEYYISNIEDYRLDEPAWRSEFYFVISFVYEKEIEPNQFFIMKSRNRKISYFNEHNQLVKEKNIFYFDSYKRDWNRAKNILQDMLVARYPELTGIDIDRSQGNWALNNMVSGDTIEDFWRIYNTSRPKREKPKGLDRFLGDITVFIERETDNHNTKTFDFIRVFVNLAYCPEEGYKKHIKDNLEEIKSRVLQKIEKNRTFQKYGISVNFLRITKMMIRSDAVLELLFELKPITKRQDKE